MDRSLYKNGFEVTQKQLTRTEDTRTFHILRRFEDMIQNGVATGLGVTPNVPPPGLDATLIDINTGFGYTPNGEFIEIVTPITAQSIRTGSSGDVFIVLFYTEIEGDPSPHESDGTTSNTSVTRAVRLNSYSSTEFNALPETDDNLDNDAKDRALIIAVVAAAAADSTITTNDITLPTAFERILTIEQPTDITGVVITFVDPDTLLTINLAANEEGQLAYDAGGGVSDPELTWQAPGDSSPGVAVVITDDGTFTLAATSGVTITVDVVRNLLPFADDTDNLTVSAFYDPDLQPRAVSADDKAHRDLRNVPTILNAHGVRLRDLADAQAGHLAATVSLVTGVGLQNTQANAAIPQIISGYASFTGPEAVRRSLIWESARQSLASTAKVGTWRIYGAAAGLSPGFANTFELVFNAFWDGENDEWVQTNTGQFSTKLTMSTDIGILSLHRVDPATGTWADNAWGIDDHIWTFRGGMKLGDELNGTTQAAQEVPRLQINRSAVADASKTLIFKSDIQGAGPHAIRIYRSRFADASGVYALQYGQSTVGECLEITLNARWDGSPLPGTWFRDSGIADSYKITIAPRSMTSAWKDVGSPDGWLDDHAILRTNPLVAQGGWDLLNWEHFPEFNFWSLDDVRFQWQNPVSAVGSANPPNTAGQTNAFMAKNIPKAWGSVTMGGASPVIDDGFNLISVGFNGNFASVGFAGGSVMANTDYVVVVTQQDNGSGLPIATTWSARGRSISQFDIAAQNGGVQTNLSVASAVAGVIVFGEQA